MDNRLEAKLGMYDTVRGFAGEYIPTINSLPALTQAYDDFIALHDEIRKLLVRASNSTKPATAKKAFIRDTMETETLLFAGALTAYASKNDLRGLAFDAHITKTMLVRMTDEMVATACRRIANRAEQYLSALSAFGIDANRIAAFKEMIGNYESVNMAPKNALSERFSAREVLRLKVTECDKLLKNQLDKTVFVVKEQNRGFYFGYMAARRIYNNPTHSTTLRIHVTGTNSQPIAGARVTVIGTDRAQTTTANGMAQFKPIPPGIYTIEVSHEDFQTVQLHDVNARLGKTGNYSVIMLA